MGTGRKRAIAGALLGTFAGDAVGAGFEGAPPADDRDGRARVERALADGTLTYTDDTQLALALAEHCCEHPMVEPEALRERFLERFEAGRGYGAGMYRLVELWRAGTPTGEAATAVFPDGSYGNGAAMRVAPVGALWADDVDSLEEAARRQARLTHVHPLGVDAAVLQARAVGMAAAGSSFGPSELRALAAVPDEDEVGEEMHRAIAAVDAWREDPDLTLADVSGLVGTAVVGHRSVPAALWAAAVSADVEHAIARAVGLGGDADTLGAMAGAVAGAADGHEAIPARWRGAMEDGRHGRSYVLDVAGRLAAVRG